uniref:Integrase catalytic domain-containing protein n=1 Tax=Tanacetum cinerariifolium TaxID=118510 RepID=A0A699IL24_TANCI|nr:hypothetical protein [Tanacetum cinerariifolium]
MEDQPLPADADEDDDDVEKDEEDKEEEEHPALADPSDVSTDDLGHPQQALKNKEIIESGCSRHMTGNKAYLANYQEIIDEGFVAFGLSRGKITGKEFKNRDLDEFCGMKGIKREYSNARTLQQNGVTERKNMTLIEAAKTMLAGSLLPITFWAEAVNTACYVLNRALVTKSQNKTPYELLNVSAGNQTDKNAGPQDTNGDAATDDKPKDDTGSKTVEKPVNKEDQAYKDELDMLTSQEKEASDATDALRKEFELGCINQRGATKVGSTNSFNTVSNPVNAVNDFQIPNLENTDELRSTGIFTNAYGDDFDIFTSPVQSVGAEADFNNMDSSILVSPIPTHRVHIDHPKDQILGDPKFAIQIRGMAKKTTGAHALLEPKKVAQALDDESWVEAMQEELLNKKDERGIVVRNKARLVAQGHRQEERIEYDEVFAPVARIEAIKILLAFASFMGFNLYQMDVKSAFLYGTIEKEVLSVVYTKLPEPEPLNDVYVTPTLTKKVFSNMIRKSEKFSGTITPLFATMLVPPAVVEGEGSGNPPESQPTPSHPQPINESQIPESSSSPQNTQSPRQTLEGTGGGDSLVRAATTASLDAHQDSSNITKTQSKATLNAPTPQGKGSGSGPGRQKTMEGSMAHIRYEGALIQSIDPPISTGYTVGSGEDKMEHEIKLTNPVPQTPYDSPLSGGHTPRIDEGSMTLRELMDLCTTLLQKVLDLENVKIAQAKEIASLKKRV